MTDEQRTLSESANSLDRSTDGYDKLLAKQLRALLSASKPAAPAQSGEPVYQIEQSNGSWLDVSKVAYQSTEDYRRRIVYTAPKPSQPVEADDGVKS